MDPRGMVGSIYKRELKANAKQKYKSYGLCDCVGYCKSVGDNGCISMRSYLIFSRFSQD